MPNWGRFRDLFNGPSRREQERLEREERERAQRREQERQAEVVARQRQAEQLSFQSLQPYSSFYESELRRGEAERRRYLQQEAERARQSSSWNPYGPDFYGQWVTSPFQYIDVSQEWARQAAERLAALQLGEPSDSKPKVKKIVRNLPDWF